MKILLHENFPSFANKGSPTDFFQNVTSHKNNNCRNRDFYSLIGFFFNMKKMIGRVSCREPRYAYCKENGSRNIFDAGKNNNWSTRMSIILNDISFPAEHFTILEPGKLSIDYFYIRNANGQDNEALKL